MASRLQGKQCREPLRENGSSWLYRANQTATKAAVPASHRPTFSGFGGLGCGREQHVLMRLCLRLVTGRARTASITETMPGVEMRVLRR